MSLRSTPGAARLHRRRPAGLSPGAVRITTIAIGCALAIAACGGSGSGGTGTGTATGTAAAGSNPFLKFATCMRSHGVPSFPDPSAGGGISIGSGSGVDPQSPAFHQAQSTCHKLLPAFLGGGPIPAAARSRALAMSRCMRTHGVPDFPDPTFPAGGGARIAITPGSGVDPQSPAFRAAARACGGPPGPNGHLQRSIAGPGG